MEPTLPDGGVPIVRELWQWLVWLGGILAVGWRAGRLAGNTEAKTNSLITDHNELVVDVEEIKKNGCFTRADCIAKQTQCQEITHERFMLALEKRDREFDRKFSTICQGIAEIKAEIKR